MTVSLSRLEKVPSHLARGVSMTHVYFIEAKLTQKSVTHNTHKTHTCKYIFLITYKKLFMKVYFYHKKKSSSFVATDVIK